MEVSHRRRLSLECLDGTASELKRRDHSRPGQAPWAGGVGGEGGADRAAAVAVATWSEAGALAADSTGAEDSGVAGVAGMQGALVDGAGGGPVRRLRLGRRAWLAPPRRRAAATLWRREAAQVRLEVAQSQVPLRREGGVDTSREWSSSVSAGSRLSQMEGGRRNREGYCHQPWANLPPCLQYCTLLGEKNI